MKRIPALLALAAALSLAGCKSHVEKAFERCVEKNIAKLKEQADRGPAALKESLAKEGNLKAFAEATCGPIRSMCAGDPDGTMCKQTIETWAGKEDE